MKNILLTLLIAFSMQINVEAQSPESFTYQAIIRHPDGSVVSNTLVGLRISILATSPTGASLCIEEFTPTTNDYGLVTLDIGSVNPTDFQTINWGTDKYFVKIEIDLNGGATYTDMGTSQLLSVPYALHAKVAESVPITGNEPAFDGWDKDEDDAWSKAGNNPFILNGKVGIGTDNPDYFITINSAESNSYMAFRNSFSGPTLYDGFLAGISTTGITYLWNYEDNDIRFGTNNMTRMTIDNDGDVGIGTSSPSADLHVNGRSKFGLNGTAFIAIQEHTGTTHATNSYVVTTLPSGFNETNTRVLSLEIQYNSDRWVGLGYNSSGSYDLSYLLNSNIMYIYYPDVTQLKGRAFRVMLMRVE